MRPEGELLSPLGPHFVVERGRAAEAPPVDPLNGSEHSPHGNQVSYIRSKSPTIFLYRRGKNFIFVFVFVYVCVLRNMRLGKNAAVTNFGTQASDNEGTCLYCNTPASFMLYVQFIKWQLVMHKMVSLKSICGGPGEKWIINGHWPHPISVLWSNNALNILYDWT